MLTYSHTSNSTILDTGATHHFFTAPTTSSSHPHLLDIQPDPDGVQVLLPNHSSITSTHKAKLNLPKLSGPAKSVHLFPSLASGNLLSVSQLCDVGCTATFNKSSAVISHNGEPIIQGSRHPITKLWHMNPLDPQCTPCQNTANTTLGQPNAAARMRFYHAALFSPPLSTFHQAVRSGFLSSFPGLSLRTLQRHPPISEATIKGHLNAKRHSLRSTKKTYSTPNYVFNATSIKPERTHNVYATCFSATGKIFTDQTRPFLLQSVSGNKYVFVLYDYDSNFIATVAIPARTKEHLVRAYRSVVTLLQRRGLCPRLQRLDNEISNLMRSEMDHHNISYQLTPAGNHGRNAAERAIQTFKNHFVAGLCSVHPQFPLRHWDKLLPQAELTLNLLRPSRLAPHLSAYNLVHGTFDYSSHPLAPPGIRVLAHDLPAQRKSWAPHASEGFYLGPALDHYRCYRILNPKTNAVRIAETVRWLPHNFIRIPTPTPDDLLRASVHDFIQTLRSVKPQ